MNIPPGKWEHPRERHPRDGSSLVRNWRGAAIRALTRRNRLARELAQERARWRNGRRVPELKRERMICGVLERNEYSDNTIGERRTDHIDLRRWGLKIPVLFGSFCLADHVTKRTWMRAIESLSYCPA